ncbi:Thioredoxin-like protein AAED1 [Hypsizygus marmoreus]|uniref:Thioredoxin-like protein AAED1 n=1 Tax=Hypsizygus marmoreus TaxID=39966 RepID=A0A369JV43_HYPMA|nr:Thioredoxin-like protein AAED1 [Hypsizygus marmoreus]
MSTPRTIKRKPPPLFDERYPTPDPADPFAPLWVLRSRSSNPALSLAHSKDNVRGITRKPSYELYPSFLENEVLPPFERLKESHYRRRSQSTPPTQVLSSPIAFPSIQSTPRIYAHPTRTTTDPVPSLFTDNTSDSGSGTDVEPTSNKVELPSRPSTPIRLARFLLPKKTRNSITAMENPFRIRAPSVKHIAKQFISPPTEIKQLDPLFDFQSSHSINDLRTPEPPLAPLRRFVTSEAPSPSHELEGYHSQPEALSRTATSQPIRSPESTPMSNPPPPPSRTHSFSSSSYVHISSPSISTCYSTPDDTHAYTSPRPAPAPAPHPSRPSTSASTGSPFLKHRTCLAPKQQQHQHNEHLRHLHTRSHPHPPPLLLPIQTEWSLPTPFQLAYAASLSVVAESGVRVSFGSLFAAQRTVVVFIRHFWCPLCQDYMTSLVSLAHPDMMYAEAGGEGEGEKGQGQEQGEKGQGQEQGEKDKDKEKGEKERVQLVVISNGSHAFIGKYRQLFDLPFSMYTDPSLALYVALGMGRDGDHALVEGDQPRKNPEEKLGREKPEVLDGGYVKHGLVSGIAMVVLRAVKIGMPVWEKGGDINQLGGEFVLGPGLTCTFAHRMQATKGHAPVRDVLEAAGIDVPLPILRPEVQAHTPESYAWDLGSGSGNKHKVRLQRGTSMREFGARRRHSVDPGVKTEGAARSSFMQTQLTHEEEDEWMKERMRSLERLKERKNVRRGAFVGYGYGFGPVMGKKRGGSVSVSENGLCSPVAEAEEEVVGQVLVIGFKGERGDDDTEEGVSPTGATEDCDVRSEVGRPRRPYDACVKEPIRRPTV